MNHKRWTSSPFSPNENGRGCRQRFRGRCVLIRRRKEKVAQTVALVDIQPRVIPTLKASRPMSHTAGCTTRVQTEPYQAVSTSGNFDWTEELDQSCCIDQLPKRESSTDNLEVAAAEELGAHLLRCRTCAKICGTQLDISPSAPFGIRC